MKTLCLKNRIQRTGLATAFALMLSCSAMSTSVAQTLNRFSDNGMTGDGIMQLDPSVLESGTVQIAPDPNFRQYTSAPSAPISYPTATSSMMNEPMIFSDSSYTGDSSCTNSSCSTDGCTGCGQRYYASYEYLMFKRSGDFNYTLSQNTRLEPFDYESGGRYTLGMMYDCLDGTEVTFVGPIEWNRRTAITGTNLQSHFTLDSTLGPGQTSAFNNAVAHSQVYRAQFTGLEVNRRWWAWDIMSTYIGLRGMEYEEDYGFTSVGLTNELGFASFSTDNLLVGGHAGADMLYPVSQRLSFGAKTRVGLFANFNEGSAFVANEGNVVINAVDKDADFSSMIETGLIGRYRLFPYVVLKGGYESWYLINVATVPGQSPHTLSTSTGRRVRTSDSVLLHGITAGVEVSF